MGSHIRDGLWLGSLDDACNTKQLKQQSVSHILSVEFRPLSAQYCDGFSYKFVHANDLPNQDLISHFKECFEFIDDALAARKKGEIGEAPTGGVLVHCYMGYSRSSTIVIAYLMQKESLTFVDALESVRKLRCVGPNPGFSKQLQLFEKMGCTVDKNNPDFRAFCLKNVSDMIRQFPPSLSTKKFGQKDLEGSSPLADALASDPSSDEGSEDLIFKCRKCRRPLARGSSVVAHYQGRENISQDKVACTLSTFVEPVDWMQDQILTLEGKMHCPKCQAKVGTFNWAGKTCPCGRWVVPAFHLARNKIDKDFVSSRTA